jgi:manganese/zinc/iron transport system permease protein
VGGRVTSGQVEIQLIAVVTAVACSLVGVFLVLRRMALVSDAISHAILLGIVVGFFAVGSVTSPLLVVGATLTGLLTVTLVQLLERTRLVREDAAIGLVFPALFSIGVILIARYADDVHLDVDAVLLGELAFAPFDRLVFWGWDWGPTSLVVMGAILVVDAIAVAAFWKELKLSTFDAGLAVALGFAPALVHYGLMTLVSVTAVGAFNAVGSILVVALMIAPPATAYLLTDSLARMVAIAAGVGAASALGGYWLSYLLDASIAGSMASVAGALFVVSWLVAPERGLVAQARRRARQRLSFAQTMLAIHLANHEGKPEAAEESRVEHLGEHLRWDDDFAGRVVRGAERRGLVVESRGSLALTHRGRRLAQEALAG